jgi:hypothetical protein
MEQSKRNTETLEAGSAPADGESRSGSGTRLCTGTSSSSMFSPHSLRFGETRWLDRGCLARVLEGIA